MFGAWCSSFNPIRNMSQMRFALQNMWCYLEGEKFALQNVSSIFIILYAFSLVCESEGAANGGRLQCLNSSSSPTVQNICKMVFVRSALFGCTQRNTSSYDGNKWEMAYFIRQCCFGLECGAEIIVLGIHLIGWMDVSRCQTCLHFFHSSNERRRKKIIIRFLSFFSSIYLTICVAVQQQIDLKWKWRSASQ